MKKLILGIVTAVIASVWVNPGMAQDPDNPFFLTDEILPVYKHPGQKAVCMASCDDYFSDCEDVTITFYDQDGNVLVNQSFPLIPNNGNRFIIYTGPQKNISCKITSEALIVSRIKRTVAILDATYQTVSMTANDADTLFQ